MNVNTTVPAPARMSSGEAEWVAEHVLKPAFGLIDNPRLMGQTTCLHLAPSVCRSCHLGYHVCKGQAWPELHETYVRDHHGSWLFWAGNLWEQRVWIPPRRCQCACPPDTPPHERGVLFDL